VIGDYVTEVNVTCPTGIRQLERAGDVRVSEPSFDVITSKLG
jgi:glutathione synthase/RimK-type ligase-like ATP-grasp enzyme